MVDIREHFASVDNPNFIASGSMVSFNASWADGMLITAAVRLVTTTPYFGGVRYWYQCPRCQGRVAKLYVTGSCPDLACRRCSGLVYVLQYRKDDRTAFLHSIATRRLTRKASRFIEKLSASVGNERARMGYA